MNDRLLLHINGWAGKSRLLDNFMIFSARYLVYIVFVVAIACVAYYARKREWKPIIYFFATLVVSFVLLQFAGLVNFDHRPFMDHQLTQLVAHAAGKSFPSDHTTVTAAIAFGLLLFTRFKALGVAVLAAACLIGFARVFVGIHYPADIVGALLTAAFGAAVVFVAKKLIDGKSSSTIVSHRRTD